METAFQNSRNEYSDAELEDVLEAEHREILEQARLKGIHFARMLKPSAKGDTLVFYTSEFSAKYDRMIALVRQKIQAENASIDAQILTDTGDEKARTLQEKQQQVQTEQYNFELELQQNGFSLDDIALLQQKKNFFVILVAIGICELAFNAGAFQILGDSLLFSIIISLGVTGALFYLAKHLAQFLKENTAESRKKSLVIAGTVITALSVFYLLAKLRSEYLSEQSHSHISPFLLVFVNVLFFVVTLWYYHRHAITKQDKEQYEKLLKYKERLDDLKKQDEELQQQIDRVKQVTSSELRTLLHKPGYAKWLCQKIARWKTEAIETFKASNLSHRSDRKAPDCFLQSTEPNDIYYQPINP